MTDINHRRKNKPAVNRRYNHYDNGYSTYTSHSREEPHPTLDEVRNAKRENNQRVGRGDYLDKSLHGWSRKSTFIDRNFGASIGNDFCNGHRGMAKAVRGAKKYVRSRTRFHENSATKKLIDNLDD